MSTALPGVGCSISMATTLTGGIPFSQLLGYRISTAIVFVGFFLKKSNNPMIIHIPLIFYHSVIQISQTN